METVAHSTARQSNIEAFRIVCMLFIIAHHFVVHTGLVGEPMLSDPRNASSLFLSVLGMWGKTGINCFLMITGYFMCKKDISINKWYRLYLQILFYNFIISTLFIAGGGEMSFLQIVTIVFPFVDISRHFVNCYLVFYLLIPFINILIRNLSIREYQLLILLMVIIYSLIGMVPFFVVQFSYVTWFFIVYLIAAYLRLYPNKYTCNHTFWKRALLGSAILSLVSVLFIQLFVGRGEWIFVSDSNAIFALLVSVSAFMWVKDIYIPYNKAVNVISTTVFGVLLIHDNSNFMRYWLWKSVVGGTSLFDLPVYKLILFSISTVCVVFFVCSIIDLLRQRVVEGPLFEIINKKK